MTDIGIGQNIAQGLGALVWWDLDGASIRTNDLRQVLADAGEDAAIVEDIDPVRAVRDAAGSWSVTDGHGRRVWRAEVVHEAITPMRGQRVIEVGLLERTRPSEHEAAWVQRDLVTYVDTVPGCWADKGGTEQAANFMAAADERRTYLDHNWVRPKLIMRRLHQLSAFSLRSHGGIYFVPRQHASALDRLGNVVARIGRCRLAVVTAQPTAQGREAIAGEARGHLEARLAEVRGQLDLWRDRACKGMRSDAVESTIEEFRSLKDAADLYEDALATSLDDLRLSVDEAAEELRELLAGRIGPDEVVRHLARWERIVAQGVDAGNGLIRISGAVLVADGLPRSALSAGYYSTGHPAGRALRALGYLPRVVKGHGDDAALILRRVTPHETPAS